MDSNKFGKVRHTLWLTIYSVVAILCAVFLFILISKTLKADGLGGFFANLLLIPAEIILMVLGASFSARILLISMEDASWFWFVFSLVLIITYGIGIVRFFTIF